VFGWAFLANAIGMAAGLGLASECIEFDELAYDIFNSSCGGWGTAGARTAALTLPLLSVATATRFAGRTDGSHGKFLQTMVAAATIMVPGYALSSSGLLDGFGSTRAAGQVFLFIGVPLAATVADRYLRTERDGR